jgi:hypothetical protein
MHKKIKIKKGMIFIFIKKKTNKNNVLEKIKKGE